MEWRIETKENYYPVLCKFWEDWDFPNVPYELLPNKIFVTYNSSEKIDLYAVPLYLTDSGICWLGFPTSNKKAPREYKKGALEFLLEVIENNIKKEGFSLLLTTSNTKKLMEVFENSNFKKSDEGTNFYTKNI